MREINLADFLLASPVVYRGVKEYQYLAAKPYYQFDKKWRLSSDEGNIWFKNTSMCYMDGQIKFKNAEGIFILLTHKIDHIFKVEPYEKVPTKNGLFSGDYDYYITTTDGREIFISCE